MVLFKITTMFINEPWQLHRLCILITHPEKHLIKNLTVPFAMPLGTQRLDYHMV